MADNIVLTIVTVCFRDPSGLSDTLNSVQSQIGFSSVVEVIVVDGSMDEATAVLVDKFSSHWPKGLCRLVSEPDNGVYDAMNKGTALARGKYVQYLNSGDAFHDSSALAQVEKLFAASPQWAISGAVHGFGTGKPQASIQNLPYNRLRHAFGLQPHCHQACWFTTDTVRALGGYDSSFGFVADFDLVLRFGFIAPPAMASAELIFYQGGGMSANRGNEIPYQIAAVRKERLYNNARVPVIFDTLFVWGQSSRRKLAVSVKSVFRVGIRWWHA